MNGRDDCKGSFVVLTTIIKKLDRITRAEIVHNTIFLEFIVLFIVPVIHAYSKQRYKYRLTGHDIQ